MMRKLALCVVTAFLIVSMGCEADKSFAKESAISKNVSISFTDISAHWAKMSIEQAVEKGYVDGYEDRTFRPEQNVSRAEFLKMVVTAMKIEMNSVNRADDSWYSKYVNAAVNLGIHRWDDFTTGDWNSPISRLEMARIADRATDPMLRKKEVRIDDKSAMYTAAKNGLIQGHPGGEPGADKMTTRAESVTMVERILTLNDGGKLVVDKYALSNAELALKRTNIFTVMPEFFGGAQLQGYEWNPANLFVETPDGKYRGVLDELVAIDLDDPIDPNLSLLPSLEKIRWFNLRDPNKSLFVKDFMHSYVLYFKSHIDYNKDTSIYSDYSRFIPKQISGFKHPDNEAFMNGNLNSIATLFVKQVGDLPAFIIPKSATASKQLRISLFSPAIPPNPDNIKDLLMVSVDEIQ